MDKIKTIISILIISYTILCILADVSIINFDIELYIPSTYAILFSAIFLGSRLIRQDIKRKMDW